MQNEWLVPTLLALLLMVIYLTVGAVKTVTDHAAETIDLMAKMKARDDEDEEDDSEEVAEPVKPEHAQPELEVIGVLPPDNAMNMKGPVKFRKETQPGHAGSSMSWIHPLEDRNVVTSPAPPPITTPAISILKKSDLGDLSPVIVWDVNDPVMPEHVLCINTDSTTRKRLEKQILCVDAVIRYTKGSELATCRYTDATMTRAEYLMMAVILRRRGFQATVERAGNDQVLICRL